MGEELKILKRTQKPKDRVFLDFRDFSVSMPFSMPLVNLNYLLTSRKNRGIMKMRLICKFVYCRFNSNILVGNFLFSSDFWVILLIG